mmetsp:Transcript_7135/g.15202  ORF Transcript_7135/g.15202 Transcript_7135/m.15202 type:complete len:437 (-) Transcript_7135:1588-2898(-)
MQRREIRIGFGWRVAQTTATTRGRVVPFLIGFQIVHRREARLAMAIGIAVRSGLFAIPRGRRQLHGHCRCQSPSHSIAIPSFPRSSAEIPSAPHGSRRTRHDRPFFHQGSDVHGAGGQGIDAIPLFERRRTASSGETPPRSRPTRCHDLSHRGGIARRMLQTLEILDPGRERHVGKGLFGDPSVSRLAQRRRRREFRQQNRCLRHRGLRRRHGPNRCHRRQSLAHVASVATKGVRSPHDPSIDGPLRRGHGLRRRSSRTRKHRENRHSRRYELRSGTRLHSHLSIERIVELHRLRNRRHGNDHPPSARRIRRTAASLIGEEPTRQTMGQRHAVEESSHRQILRRWTARRGRLRNAPLSIAHSRNFDAKAKHRSAGQRCIVFPGLLEGASERTSDSFGGGIRMGSARRRESATVAFGVLLSLRMGHDLEYVSATESS